MGGQSRLPWGRMLRALEMKYERGTWRVPVLRGRGADPFLVLVSTIISQRTRDQITERATLRLLARYPTPRDVARAPLQLIRGLIQEAGLSAVKASAIKLSSQIIVDEFGGTVPTRAEDLLRLPGVGPKTAHAVRVFAYRKPGLPIDTHILRITRRLGVVRGESIADAQRELAQSVPRKYWGLLNPVLVQHGQNTCRASSPKCETCPIARWCPRVGVDHG